MKNAGSVILTSMPERLSLSNFDAVLFDVDGTHVDSLEMLVRGLRDAVETNACRMKTALITSKNAIELQSFLPRFPGTPFLHATVCASDVIHSKPAAYGAAPREVLLAENPDMLVDTPRELLAWAESTLLQTPCPERS